MTHLNLNIVWLTPVAATLLSFGLSTNQVVAQTNYSFQATYDIESTGISTISEQHPVHETNVMTYKLSTKKVSQQHQTNEANNMLSELSMEELDTVVRKRRECRIYYPGGGCR